MLEREGRAAAVRLARRLTLGVGAAVWSYAALVLLFAPWLLSTIYGSEFEAYAGPARVVALSVSAITLGFGAQQVLKAARRARSLWFVRVVGTGIAVTATVILTGRFGVIGAAYGNLILSINLQIREVSTGRLVRAGTVSIRGNTDESWSRGLLFLLKRRIFND